MRVPMQTDNALAFAGVLANRTTPTKAKTLSQIQSEQIVLKCQLT